LNHPQIIQEYRQLVKLALPITIAQIAQIANGFIDTIMAGRIGPLALGAIAIGVNLWIPVYLFCVGLLMATSSMVSHHFGAGRYSRIKDLAVQSTLVALILGVIGFFVIRQTTELMGWIGISEDIVPVSAKYLMAVSWGFPAVCIYLVLRFLSEGIGFTRPMMFIQVIGLPINALLNYIFMFGKLGAPAMGAVGAGWATAAVMWISLLILIAYILMHRRYSEIWLSVHKPAAWGQTFELIRLGSPIGFSLVSEVGMFAAVALLMGSLGVVEVAAHQIAMNFAAMMFMIPFGIAAATTVRVGHALGDNRIAIARQRGMAGISLASLCMFITAAVLLIFPDRIVSIYTTDVEVASMAKSLLLMAALFQFSDGVQVSSAGALRGMKDTFFPMIVSFAAYWLIGLPLSYYLGINQHFGPQGLWMGLVGGLSVAAVLLLWRFLAQSRKKLAADFTH
jgi:MATE family multidrug resistance protein